jgi:hypothetical protein
MPPSPGVHNEPVDPNWVIQGTQAILRLLSELGLDKLGQNGVPSSGNARVTVEQAEQRLRNLGLPVPDLDQLDDE